MNESQSKNCFTSPPKPSFWRIALMFALVWALYTILSAAGIFQTSFVVGRAMNFGALFVIGLVAASSSCLAVTGGLLLSVTASYNEHHPNLSRKAKMIPVISFVIGRIFGYGVLGGLLGVIGRALTISPTTTAVISILAAVYMLVMGLDLLGLAPHWLKALMPSIPKSLGHKILKKENNTHPLAPFVLGALTFFLPCGFTQALQLYTLTTGSFAGGLMTMLPFALGTAPALLLLGFAASSLKGKTGQFFFHFAGALVVVLAFFNLQNAFAILGIPLFASATPTTAATNSVATPPLENGVQVVKMNVSAAGYSPGRFTVKKGIPVRWEIQGSEQMGCASVLVSRSLGLQKFLTSGQNVVEFTPNYAGDLAFSCSMGMFRGSFTVIN